MKPVKPQEVPKESFIAQFLTRRLVPELSPIKVHTFEVYHGRCVKMGFNDKQV